MMVQNSVRSICTVITLAFIFCCLLYAEEGIIVLHVADTEGRPISGVVLSTKGEGSTSAPTDGAGKTRIRLARNTRVGNWVTLQVVKVLNGRDLVFISPWDSQVRVPAFENESDNFVPIVLAERGDRALLENGKALAAITARINAANALRSANEEITEVDQQTVLDEQGRAFGLEPKESDIFVPIRRAKRGDRALLMNRKALATLAARINAANARKSVNEEIAEEERRSVLNEQAHAFGLEPEEMDRAIRVWGQKTKDSHEKGLVALYVKNYPEAVKQFSESLHLREKELRNCAKITWNFAQPIFLMKLILHSTRNLLDRSYSSNPARLYVF